MKHSILFFTFLILSSTIFCSPGPDSLNTAFGNAGIQTLFSGYNIDERVTEVIVQPDNKIVYAGIALNASVVGRLFPDGSQDTTFNSNGTPGYNQLTPVGSSHSIFNSAVLQPDGKCVAVGTVTMPTTNYQYVLIARFLADGTLDTAGFNASSAGVIAAPGYYVLQIGANLIAEGKGVILQDDGKIVVTGNSSPLVSNSSSGVGFVARFTSTGVLDSSSFNSAGGQPGVVTADFTTFVGSHDVSLQTNQKIVIAGAAYTTSTQQNIFLARYTTAGILDTTFGTNGIYQASFGSYFPWSNVLKIAVQGDDKIIVTGAVDHTSTGFTTQTCQYMTARFTADGTGFDTTFNTAATPGYNAATVIGTFATGLCLQENAQILSCGTNHETWIITRYNQDGTIDPSCNTTLNSTSTIQAQSINVSPIDGKIITGGLNLNVTYSLYFMSFLGGQTPEPGVTTAVNLYGHNSTWVPEFMYITTYAQVISDATAQTAAIDTANTILSNYIFAYSGQSNFNFISYLYLINSDLDAAQITLIAAYPASTMQIIEFMTYLKNRIRHLGSVLE